VRRSLLLLLALLCLVVPAIAIADAVTGTAGDDTLAGTAGDDILSGLAGNDRLDGAAGNDTLDGGPGTDDMAGGTGRDAAVHPAAGGVAVTLDDLANDGAAGEQDNVQADIEDVFGSPGNDVLEGSASANTMDGGAGDDRIDGLGGRDALFGGDGADRITSRDGLEDQLDCGTGEDIVFVDTEDVLTGCEIVDREERTAPADGTVRNSWRVFATFTINDDLSILEPDPGNATVEVRCSGGGCPFGTRTVKLKRKRTVSFNRQFRNRRLKPGVKVEVRITAPGRIGKVVRYTMGRGTLPKRAILCLKPGKGKPRKSC